jgi:hypothetical protein
MGQVRKLPIWAVQCSLWSRIHDEHLQSLPAHCTDRNSVCYNLHTAQGQAALVTDSHGVHGVRFDQNFMYMGLKRLIQATQLISGKCNKHAGFPLTR